MKCSFFAVWDAFWDNFNSKKNNNLDNIKSYKNIPIEGAGKLGGCFSTPKHLLVYGLAKEETIISMPVYS